MGGSSEYAAHQKELESAYGIGRIEAEYSAFRVLRTLKALLHAGKLDEARVLVDTAIETLGVKVDAERPDVQL